MIDPVLDAPGDLRQPFSVLRLVDTPAELRITRRVLGMVADCDEDPTLSERQTFTLVLAALVGALKDVESELVELRRWRKDHGC